MPEREMITCKLEIQCLYRATKSQRHAAAQLPGHVTISSVLTNPTGQNFPPTHRQQELPGFKRKPFSLSLLMRWTWACDVLGWSSLAAPAPCSQALQTGDQRYSPVGRGPHSQESSGEQSIWPGLHPSMWSCSHHSPGGARNMYTLYV